MRGKKPKEREQYVLYIGGFLVEVTKEVYLEWYQSRRREKYQTEKQKKLREKQDAIAMRSGRMSQEQTMDMERRKQ